MDTSAVRVDEQFRVIREIVDECVGMARDALDQFDGDELKATALLYYVFGSSSAVNRDRIAATYANALVRLAKT